MNMNPVWARGIGLIFVLSLLQSGCSLFKKGEDQLEDPPTDQATAQTDAVPEQNAEAANNPITQAEAPAEPSEETKPAEEAKPAETAADSTSETAPAEPPKEEPQQEVAKNDEVPAPPAAAPAPLEEPTSSEPKKQTDYMDYAVRPADTLMKIAFEVYGNIFKWKQIYEMNKEKIDDPNALRAGIRLKLEQPTSPFEAQEGFKHYIIQKGDTLSGVSSKVYGTPQHWRMLWKHNKQLIQDPNKIYAGFYLYYPTQPGREEEVSPKPLATDPNEDRKPSSR